MARSDPGPRRTRRPAKWLGLLAAVALAPAADAPPPRLPPILFVSRAAVPGPGHEVPGLGPHRRAVITRGRLLVREPDGHVRDFLPARQRPWDASDPAVSASGGRVAFAAVFSPGARWRIWTARADGSEARALDVRPPTGMNAQYDDLDPCWIDERTIVFASTRESRPAEYAPVAVTNLYVVDLERPAEPRRITFDRNGAEEPAWDAEHERIVYSRWWFNRYHPSAAAPFGVSARDDGASAADTVNLWHAVSIDRDGNDLRLAAGAVSSRRGTMAYQPAMLPGGAIVAVYSRNTGLSPGAGSLGLHELPALPGPPRRIAGAILDDAEETGYGTPRGLQAPAACSPAAAPGGRIVFAYDPGGRGDFGIWCVDRGGRMARLVDLPGSLELDPAVLAPARGGRRHPTATRAVAATAAAGSFEYFSQNVFASGPVDSPIGAGPALAWPLRVRFFTSVTTPDGGDSLVLVRESNVRPDGSIREAGLPADVPLFEQLVGVDGAPSTSRHGVAQVRGYNYGRPGATARCVGCHTGHSMLDTSADPSAVPWFDAAPSAAIATTSDAPDGAGTAAATDRRARGPAGRVAWIAAGTSGESLSLTWRTLVEVREIVLHGPADDPGERTRLRMRGGLTLWRAGREVARVALPGGIGPRPVRVRCGSVACDRVDVRFDRVDGTVLGRRAAALAEVEILARLPAP